jgi:hypothetical protein
MLLFVSCTAMRRLGSSQPRCCLPYTMTDLGRRPTRWIEQRACCGGDWRVTIGLFSRQQAYEAFVFGAHGNIGHQRDCIAKLQADSTGRWGANLVITDCPPSWSPAPPHASSPCPCKPMQLQVWKSDYEAEGEGDAGAGGCAWKRKRRGDRSRWIGRRRRRWGSVTSMQVIKGICWSYY